MNLPLIIALSVGLAAFGIGWLAWGYHLQISSQLRRQRQIERLDRLAHPDEPVLGEPEAEGPSQFERLALLLTGQLQGSLPSGQDGEDRVLLARAGYRGLQALVYFQAIRLGLTLAAVLVAAGIALAAGGDLNAWLKVFLAGGTAYLAPKYLLKYVAARRVREIAHELLLFVDYLRMMHGAGVSFEQALLLFAEERRVGLPVLASEFNVVRIAIKSGRARADALQVMADQINLPELRELVTLLNDADRYGAGLQEPLKRFAVRLADKRRFDMQEYVGKLATRMVVVMVLFLLPALIIITAGPGFIAVFKALSEIV